MGTTVKPGRWPWQVEIYNRHNTHQCGGALISSKWIMSAAHCFNEDAIKDADKNYFVVLGEFDRYKKYSFLEFNYYLYNYSNNRKESLLP